MKRGQWRLPVPTPIERARNNTLRIAETAVRILLRKRCHDYGLIKNLLRDKVGLEIGGPSLIFSDWGMIPVYSVAGRLDNCDFAKDTVWDCSGRRSNRLRYLGARFGYQLVSDGTSLSFRSEAYEFLLASHVLEHVANPLKTLAEWKRVLRPDGLLLLVLPHKAGTFDHRRPFTSFAHIEQDFLKQVGDDDLSHLEEILKLHDLGLDRGAGSWEQFWQRSSQNFQNRCLHHHVFSPELLVEMFTYLNMEVLSVAVEWPYHIIVCARKVDSEGAPVANGRFLDLQAEWRRVTPLDDQRN